MDEAEWKGLNKISVPVKISPKVTTDRKKEGHSRETLVPEFDKSELTPLDKVSEKWLHKVRTSGRERSMPTRFLAEKIRKCVNK